MQIEDLTKTRQIESEFNSMMSRMGHVFAGEPGFRTCQKYIQGLMGPAERKNGWQLSESQGAATPYETRQFLYRGRFKADDIRDVPRDYVAERLGGEDGVMLVDETGFLKQGDKSCGVKRQYSGTAGRKENCQIGVFPTYASSRGHSPTDRRLYIPKEWMEDKGRRKKAGIPEGLEFKTKPGMALEMIGEATAAGVPYKWVTGDCVYGDYTEIRRLLEENRKCHVMGVSGKAYVWRGHRQESVSGILRNLPPEGWFEESCGIGSKGGRTYDWLMTAINPGATEGFKRSLLIRRGKNKRDKLKAYICFAPEGTPVKELVETAGTRWTVETCFKESKSEVGLDQYEVRSYDGWNKHIILACVALAFLAVLSGESLDGKSMRQHNPAAKSLEGFKKGRNLRV